VPIDYTRYGPEWPAISRHIRERAGNRCERCGVANYAVGARDRCDVWHDEAVMHSMNSTEGFMLWPEGFPRVIRIVLTVARINHDIPSGRSMTPIRRTPRMLWHQSRSIGRY
jgi:hypothetical protein